MSIFKFTESSVFIVCSCGGLSEVLYKDIQIKESCCTMPKCKVCDTGHVLILVHNKKPEWSKLTPDQLRQKFASQVLHKKVCAARGLENTDPRLHEFSDAFGDSLYKIEFPIHRGKLQAFEYFMKTGLPFDIYRKSNSQLPSKEDLLSKVV